MRSATIIISSLLLVLKLQAQTNCNWAYIPSGTGFTQNTIYYSTIDLQHNIIQIGKQFGVADMDPSPNPSDTSFSYPTYNYYLSKTDTAGHLIWIKYLQRNSQIVFLEIRGLKVDHANNIVVLGNYYGMIDFDMSDIGVDTLRSHLPTYPDFFISKYDSLGNYIWANNYGDSVSSHISSQALSIDQNNNIIVVANPNGQIDINPDDAVIQYTIGGNANIIGYDEDGNYLWNNHIATNYSYGIPNQSLALNAQGNAYLMSVGYYELTVNHFDHTGAFLWSKKLGDFATGARVTPQSMVIDEITGNITIAGTFDGTVDFDPNVGIVSKTASGSFYEDGFIAQYDSSMQLLWVNHYEGNVSFGNASLYLLNNDIIAVGGLEGTIDFGNGIMLASTGSGSKPMYLRISNNGLAQYGFTLDGIGQFNTYNQLSASSFICSGYITNNTDMDPSASVFNLSTTILNHFNALYQNSIITNRINQQNLIASISPNPSQDFFILSAANELIGKEYVLIDCTGNILFSKILNQKNERIDCSKLVSGLYFIRFNNETFTTKKIIKY